MWNNYAVTNNFGVDFQFYHCWNLCLDMFDWLLVIMSGMTRRDYNGIQIVVNHQFFLD
jgi:hypothetical protein